MPGRKPRKRTPAPPAALAPGPGCRVEGCGRDVHARGLCEPHWEDLARSRGPFAPTRPEPEPTADTRSPLKRGMLDGTY